MAITVLPAAAARWDDVVEVFGRRGDNPAWDWCRLFVEPGPTGENGAPDNRAALRNEIKDAPVAPGLVAYLDGRPVGWSRIGPRSRFAAVTGNRTLAAVLSEEPTAWWVACFATRPEARGLGVGTALLTAAATHAAGQGATALEGYPVDVARLTATKVGAASLYTGTLPMFLAAGFVEVARPRPARPLVRLEL
jgi:GNAT superfamily N-acetyltransferase